TPAKNDFDGFMQTGQALYRAGRYPDAAAAFKKAVDLKPDNQKAQAALKQSLYAEAMARGMMYANQGKLQDAASEFRKALEAMPSDPAAGRSLGLAMAAANGGGGQFPGMRGRRGGK